MAFDVIRDDENRVLCVRRQADGVFVPKNTGNRDWRDFLAWNAQQPVPLDVEDGTPPTAQQKLLTIKAEAKAAYQDVQAQSRVNRAIVVLTVDELNVLRQWIMSFKAAVAGAATLAALKTAVAALPNLPDRTYGQAKTAVENAVDGESS